MRQFGSNPADMRLRKLMEDPRYWKDRDPAYVAMIQKGFKDLYDNPSSQARAAEGEAANEMGLNGPRHAQDSMIAHVTPDEIVLPLSAQTPELMRYLYKTLGRHLLKYTVGSGYEQENPTSGLPAFYDTLPAIEEEIRKTKRAIAEKQYKYDNEPDPNQRAAILIVIGQLESYLRQLEEKKRKLEGESGRA